MADKSVEQQIKEWLAESAKIAKIESEQASKETWKSIKDFAEKKK